MVFSLGLIAGGWRPLDNHEDFPLVLCAIQPRME